MVKKSLHLGGVRDMDAYSINDTNLIGIYDPRDPFAPIENFGTLSVDDADRCPRVYILYTLYTTVFGMSLS